MWGDCMYVVRTGRVDVITFGDVLEQRRGWGGMFWEYGLDRRWACAAPRRWRRRRRRLLLHHRTAFHAILREEPEFALAIMLRASAAWDVIR